jgi:alpha-L-fucosidase
MTDRTPDTEWFVDARYGLFVHYGLYSLLGRGEWVRNRERIAADAYTALADRFTAEKFDAEAICDLAVRAGMRYVNLTTMHHDGFRLYDTELSSFNSMNACGRDLVAEFVAAARARGLRIELYHSLNNWHDSPDAVAALESKDAYDAYIADTHQRLRELVTRFNPIDVLWYDGWWPFGAAGWQSEEMNAMVRAIQPHILFNGRNALPGDFATPERHMTAPTPWRPWEACMTMNESWGFHAGDHAWRDAGAIVDMLVCAAQGQGNLLLNIGPRGDGSVPQESVEVLESVGRWLQTHGECIFDTDLFVFGLESRQPHERGDWSSNGRYTARGNTLYQLLRKWPGETLVVAGLEVGISGARLLGTDNALQVEQVGDRAVISGLPAAPPDPLCPVVRIDCDAPPSIYLTGGMRVPQAPHPPYDPAPSDIGGAPQ